MYHLSSYPLSGLLLEGIFLALVLRLCSSSSEGLAGPQGGDVAQSWRPSWCCMHEEEKDRYLRFPFSSWSWRFRESVSDENRDEHSVVHDWEAARTKEKKEDKRRTQRGRRVGKLEETLVKVR